MKRALLFILCLIVLASCSTTKKTTDNTSGQEQSSTSPRDGSSFDRAIMIKEKREGPGVDAEYDWLRLHFPEYQSEGQSLTFDKKKAYDIIRIKTKEGEDKRIYFDISGFYGKF